MRFQVPCLSFFGDFSGACPADVSGLVLMCFMEFNSAMGFAVKAEKNEVGPSIQFLGVSVSIADGLSAPIALALPEEKREKYASQIEEVLSSSFCPASTADSIFGRLQWAESLIFGRVHRAFLMSICMQKFSRSAAVSPRLEGALRWFKKFLSRRRVRIFSKPSDKIDFVVFSDASTTGLGVCVVSPSLEKWYFAASVPHDFDLVLPVGASKIFTLECAAALFAMRVVAEFLPGVEKRVCLFVDNNVSISSIIRAYSRCELASRVIAAFWECAVERKISPWVERVRSSQNLADAPSRAPPVGTAWRLFPRLY